MSPVQEIKDLSPKEVVFRDASRTKPVVITSRKLAAKYFGKQDLTKLLKSADFKKQVVFVFAWRGSGQDKMTYATTKSLPIQIEFTIHPGRTRDLRPHVQVYLLKNELEWKGKPVRPKDPKLLESDETGALGVIDL